MVDFVFPFSNLYEYKVCMYLYVQDYKHLFLFLKG